MQEHTESRHALVMGLGRFGGGVGVAAHLLRQGLDLLITDLRSERELAEARGILEKAPGSERITWRLGGHEIADFRRTDLVVANPAIPRPWDNPYLQTAVKAGIPVTTEVELGLARCREGTVIAVTGSSGKSTTCAMIHHLLEADSKRSILGGNIGGSLLDLDDREIAEADAVVVELSSFMLHWLGSAVDRMRPSVTVLTTLSSNHVDWHGNLAHYVESKSRLRALGDHHRFVPPAREHDVSAEARAAVGGEPWWRPVEADPFEREEIRREIMNAIDLQVPGEHQRRNAYTALRAVAMHLEPETGQRPELAIRLARHLHDFTGLPHRLRPVARAHDITAIDDSKSTTPEATVLAIASFPDPTRIHLIAGGYDKGSDLEPIRALGDRVAGLYAIGETAARLVGGTTGHLCQNLDAAVHEATRRMRPGDVLLLSPGCASWDQFSDYEHRGREFLAAVQRHLVDADPA